VADRYIDVAYVDARIDRSVRVSLIGDEAAADELLRFIEDGTAATQAVMRNSGYACPATQDPTDIDPVVKQAVMSKVWEALAMKPNASLELPPNWENGPYREAWKGILSGALQPNMPQSTKNAPGGITVGTRVARATDLSGW
jgi:hypothetical protein